MKVTQNPLPQSTGMENSKATEKAGAVKQAEVSAKKGTPAPAGGEPNVSISDQARLMKEARELVYAAPDIRADKVSDLKQRIKDGSYKVDTSAVADKIVDEHLSSGFGKNDL
jgi:negative regulator of flagellin synthesis FlgM